MATHVATALNATLLGETTGQQKTPPAMLGRRPVTRSRSAGSLARPRMLTRNPSHNLSINMEEGKGYMK